jgi:hypothetical protein
MRTRARPAWSGSTARARRSSRLPLARNDLLLIGRSRGTVRSTNGRRSSLPWVQTVGRSRRSHHRSERLGPPRNHRATTAEPPRNHRAAPAEPPRSHRAAPAEPPRSHRAATAQPPRSHRAATAQPPRSDRAATRKDLFLIGPRPGPREARIGRSAGAPLLGRVGAAAPTSRPARRSWEPREFADGDRWTRCPPAPLSVGWPFSQPRLPRRLRAAPEPMAAASDGGRRAAAGGCGTVWADRPELAAEPSLSQRPVPSGRYRACRTTPPLRTEVASDQASYHYALTTRWLPSGPSGCRDRSEIAAWQ